MIKNRFRSHFFASVLAGILAISAHESHATEESESFDLATVTCWDLTGIETENRIPALMMLYGYVVGKHGLSIQYGANIAPALKRVGKLCESNPDMYVASAIERAINHPESED